MKIKLESVSFRYPSGVLALEGITLFISQGEAMAIVGENGAGKSTLAKHLNALLVPEQGQVFVGDWDTTKHSPAKLAARVGYAFQNPDDQLFAQTVQEEVAFGPRNLGFDSQKNQKLVTDSLARVGLEDKGEIHPYDLPISQRKMVVIAAILAMDTPIVILDEPTTGQDARGVSRLGQIIDNLKEEGRTVIVISHDLDFCAEHCDRVVVMAGGKIQADGLAQEVLYQEDLLRAAAVEPPQIARLSMGLGIRGENPLTVDRFVDLISRK